MKNKDGFQRFILISCISVCLLFAMLMCYIVMFENSSVFSPYSSSDYYKIEKYELQTVEDENSPTGICNEYSLVLEDFSPATDSLAFYFVHTYAEVRINGKLVYFLNPGNNAFGKSPGSNWAFIPLSEFASGSEVSVKLIPVYESVINRKTDFIIGSNFKVIMECAKNSIPQTILSSACIFFGMLLIITQTIINIKNKLSSWNVLYLGTFSLIIGIWRITDTQLSPLIFPKNPMALGYITIAALAVLPLPLLLFIASLFTGTGKRIIQAVNLINCISALIIFMLQAFSIADMRQTLILTHIIIVLDITSISIVLILYRKQINHKNLWILVIALIIGTVTDLIWYYTKGSSSGVMFTLSALLIYIIFHFFEYLTTINKNVFTDVQTGLFNKRRWDELMEENKNITSPVAILIFDLNNLKKTNDSLGHNAGDNMIVSFSDILRSTIPYHIPVCRWGGDEFTVIINSATKAQTVGYISSFKAKIKAYNENENNVPVHFAVGYALSSDFPNLSISELFEKADEYMYIDKKRWYKENNLVYNK